MTLGRTEVAAGLESELRDLSRLISGLDRDDWSTPTRCAGWKVADIAGHMVGLVADVAAGRFDDLTRPGSAERQAAARRGTPPAALAAELGEATSSLRAVLLALSDDEWSGPAPGPVPGTLGFGAEGIWFEAYVHADDIRDALGRPSVRGAGLRAAVSHLAGLLDRRGWGPATLELEGLERFTVGGGGPPVGGDALTFVLVATGRAHPIELGLVQPLNVYGP